MKKQLLTFLVIGLLLYACGGGGSSESPQKAEETVAEGPDGKKIFQTTCVACHGVWGNMQVNGAKDLTVSALTLEERINIITNGGTQGSAMIAYKNTLSEAEIRAVAEYTMTLKE